MRLIAALIAWWDRRRQVAVYRARHRYVEPAHRAEPLALTASAES
jgi:uncharacterized iron-regulated membrane protein